jgi:hypothetical protein
MQLLPLQRWILGNAPCTLIEAVSLEASQIGLERNKTGAKIAQFAGKSETQPPQRLLFVGLPSSTQPKIIDALLIAHFQTKTRRISRLNITTY